MAQVLIRNLSDDVGERLKKCAAVKGRSLEQELREIVTAAAPLSGAECVAVIDRFSRAIEVPGEARFNGLHPRGS